MKTVLIAGLILSAATAANADTALAKKNNCLACHAIDVKIVGPAYKDVAQRYSDKDVDYLVQKIRLGGSGVWGSIPMPPQPQLSAEDAKRLAQWVLKAK